MGDGKVREAICRIGRSLFDRGYTHGASGNISAALDGGGWIVTPTNVSLGSLEPDMLTHLDAAGRRLAGPAPTKEVPLHRAFYDSRSSARAVIHLHSTHSVAVSMLTDVDPADVFPPLTAYYLMRVGRTALLPYFRPGDPAVADAISGLNGTYSAILLANHGPVVAGANLDEATWAIEELEQTARLKLLLGANARLVPQSEVEALRPPAERSVGPK